MSRLRFEKVHQNMFILYEIDHFDLYTICMVYTKGILPTHIKHNIVYN